MVIRYRLGPKGRKALVDDWAQYLPLYTQSETINQQASSPAGNNNTNNSNNVPVQPPPNNEQAVSILFIYSFYCTIE